MISPIILYFAAHITTLAGVPGCWIRGETARVRERPSPLDSVMYTALGDTVKLCYGRPSARGREIMGQLIPYGAAWRMGANEATTLYLPFPAAVAGVAVEPGVYSLYAVPDAERWTVVVNRNAQRWGAPSTTAVLADEAGRGTVLVERLDAPVETLTMRFEPQAAATELYIDWERTRVRIPIARRGAR